MAQIRRRPTLPRRRHRHAAAPPRTAKQVLRHKRAEGLGNPQAELLDLSLQMVEMIQQHLPYEAVMVRNAPFQCEFQLRDLLSQFAFGQIGQFLGSPAISVRSMARPDLPKTSDECGSRMSRTLAVRPER